MPSSPTRKHPIYSSYKRSLFSASLPSQGHPKILNFAFLFLRKSKPWVTVNIPFLSQHSGKLVQIEHALTAVGSGQTSLGIKAANGVVIATEKKLPSILVDEISVQKIQCLTPNIGVVYSGMGPDFRVLVRKSRKQAEQYHRLYKEPIPVTQLVRETAAVMQEFTQSGGVRPFGVSLLVAGYDDNGPQLYQVDPSGSYFSWKASAMGKNVSNAKTFLEKRYLL
ncbi:Proteasome [Theobroma cacao]|nr:Proteasome [Theobroma cacao]